MAQVPVDPLLSQHGDERGKQRDQKTCVQETGDGNNLAWWVSPGRWDSRALTRDSGLIEGEEDRTEESYGLFVWIGFEFRADVDDERCADSREQSRLEG